MSTLFEYTYHRLIEDDKVDHHTTENVESVESGNEEKQSGKVRWTVLILSESSAMQQITYCIH